MIRPNELRIGNYIQFKNDNEIVTIKEIYQVHPFPEYFLEWYSVKEKKTSIISDDDEDDNGHSLLSDFLPIPINIELLEGCGFVVESDLDDWTSFHIPQLLSPHNKGFFKKEDQIFTINKIAKEIYYLHELQNFCFCLSDEELDIKFK